MHRPFLFASLTLTTALGLTLAACQNLPQSGSQRQQPQAFRAARAAIPIDTALGEQLAPDEAALTQSIETVTLQGMQKEAAKFPMTRDVHAKQHGCVRAFVDVDVSALPPQHRVGVFSHNQTYPAWIRYSNGMGKAKADADGDVRGFGLKLMGVPGAKLLEEERNEQTQDFLMINTPDFFIDELKNYAGLIRATNEGGLSLAGFAAAHPVMMLKLYKIMNQKVSNLLETDFFSAVPYKLGSTATKYRARPCQPGNTPYPQKPGPDYLRETLARGLAQQEGCYQFMVQLQKDPRSMPIEAASVHWDENLSPWIPVARVRIPQQAFESPAQMNFCENLSFTPWHSLPEHKPLGAPNRVRKSVYELVSKFRHAHNSAPRREPTSHDIN